MWASPSGLRRPLRVSASQGPALTVDQSGSEGSPELLLYRNAGHQPHGIGEWQSAVGRCRFDLAESVEELLEFVPIHLDPASAQELQSVGPLEQGADFGRRESLLSERQLHLKIEQRILAENRRYSSADGRPDLGPRRSARPQALGARTTIPAASRAGTSVRN